MVNDNELDKAHRTKNKNTSQQNLLTRNQIYRSVVRLREEAGIIPSPISDYLLSKDVDLANDALIDFENLSLLGLHGTFQGLILTEANQFIHFEITLNDDLSEIEFVDEWRVANDEYPINPSTPGIQKSFGFLCVQVRDEVLNGQS